MKKFLLVAALVVFGGSLKADDITVNNSDKTVIVNGPIYIIGNGNIVQIGNNNKVIQNSKTKSNKPATSAKVNKDCDESGRRHDATVNQWLSLMGKR